VFGVAARPEASDAQGRLPEAQFVYRGREAATALGLPGREW
jgi:hypothetical protein